MVVVPKLPRVLPNLDLSFDSSFDLGFDLNFNMGANLISEPQQGIGTAPRVTESSTEMAKTEPKLEFNYKEQESKKKDFKDTPDDIPHNNFQSPNSEAWLGSLSKNIPENISKNIADNILSNVCTKNFANNYLVQNLSNFNQKNSYGNIWDFKGYDQNLTTSFDVLRQGSSNKELRNTIISAIASQENVTFPKQTNSNTVNNLIGLEYFQPRKSLTNSSSSSNLRFKQKSSNAQALLSWRTLSFSSSLQLSAVIEILVSDIPKFWQAEIRLGLQEALVNAVKHGNQLDKTKQIKVNFNSKGNCYWWVIEDQGVNISSNQSISAYLTENPKLESEEAECGRGIYILQQVFNRVHWDCQKHHLYLFKQIDRFDLPCVI